MLLEGRMISIVVALHNLYMIAFHVRLHCCIWNGVIQFMQPVLVLLGQGCAVVSTKGFSLKMLIVTVQLSGLGDN